MVKIGQLFLEIPAEAPEKHREDQITVICNLHHVNTARAYCDRIIGMSQGQITFDGPPDALTPKRLREIYGVENGDDELAQALAPGCSGNALPKVRELSATD